MKKIIIYFLILIIWFFIVEIWLATYLVYTVEKNNNDCMISYVKEVKKDKNIKGFYYKTPLKNFHIDTKIYKDYEVIWEATGCIIYPINNKYILQSIFNSIYCKTAYILKT